MNSNTSRLLKQLGMILFLIGLLTGFAIMAFTNPKMGLAAHLEGVMNGTFLLVAGVIWNELKLTDGQKKVAFMTLVYGTFANWLATLLSAIFGTSEMTPLSGAGYVGSVIQEGLVTVGLITVGLTMVTSVGLMVYGLRGKLN